MVHETDSAAVESGIHFSVIEQATLPHRSFNCHSRSAPPSGSSILPSNFSSSRTPCVCVIAIDALRSRVSMAPVRQKGTRIISGCSWAVRLCRGTSTELDPVSSRSTSLYSTF